jgi:hypothetical protein
LETSGGGKGVAGMKTANSMLLYPPPLKREGNIIYFPGAWQEVPPKAPEEPPQPQFNEHCKGFNGVDFGSTHVRILWALYYLRIHSLEELVRTPVSKLKFRSRIGRKSLERILAVLESRASEVCTSIYSTKKYLAISQPEQGGMYISRNRSWMVSCYEIKDTRIMRSPRELMRFLMGKRDGRDSKQPILVYKKPGAGRLVMGRWALNLTASHYKYNTPLGESRAFLPGMENAGHHRFSLGFRSGAALKSPTFMENQTGEPGSRVTLKVTLLVQSREHKPVKT